MADLVAAGYAPSTIRRAYTLLQLALEMAVDDGRLARSPCRRITLPRIGQSEKRFLDIGEVEHLAETVLPRYRVFVLTGAYTGLRPGELAALRTDRLDLPRRQLRVEEPIKTPAARRTVSFSPFLAEELTTHLDTYPGEKNLVFTAPEGGPLDLPRLPSPLLVPGRTGVGRRTDAAARPPPHPRRAAHRRRRRPLRHLPTTRARLDPHHLRHLRTPVRRPGPTGRRRPRSRPGSISRGLSADSAPIRRALTRASETAEIPRKHGGFRGVELEGFEPSTSCMPCKIEPLRLPGSSRSATACAGVFMLTPSRRFSPFLTLVWGWCGVESRRAAPSRCGCRNTPQRSTTRGELCDFCDFCDAPPPTR